MDHDQHIERLYALGMPHWSERLRTMRALRMPEDFVGMAVHVDGSDFIECHSGETARARIREITAAAGLNPDLLHNVVPDGPTALVFVFIEGGIVADSRRFEPRKPEVTHDHTAS